MSFNPSAFGPKPQFVDLAGAPASGYQLFTYVSGSVDTKQNSYTDATGGTANPNPIVLDSLGQPQDGYFWQSGETFTVVLASPTDTDPPTSPIWTVPGLKGQNDVTAVQSEWKVGPAPTFASATSFTLQGDQTSIFEDGIRLQIVDAVGTKYATIDTASYDAGSGLTTVNTINDGSLSLQSPLSSVSFGILSPQNISIPEFIQAGTGGITVTYDSQGRPVINGPSRFNLTSYRNWRSSSIGLTNYNVVCTADEMSLVNSTGLSVIQTAVNKTINANGTVGAPLSIMQARAINTWYTIVGWFNVALGLTFVLDNNPSAPTAPTGYVSTDYKAVMPGVKRSDTDVTNKYFLQLQNSGDDSQYILLTSSNTPNMPIIMSGASGTPSTGSYTAVPIGAFVPPAATRIRGTAGRIGGGSGAFIFAPNNNYGGQNSTTNPPAVTQNTTSTSSANQFDFMIESANVYYASDGNGIATCSGWRENI